MKKIVLVVLVSALLMTACGKKHTQITEKLQDQTEHVESVEEEETKTDQELSEAKESQKDSDFSETADNQNEGQELIPIDIDVSGEYIGEWLDGNTIIQGHSATLRILSEGYDKLENTFQEFNETNWQEVQEIYQEYYQQAMDQYNSQGFSEYDISRKINLLRADNKIVSFTSNEESYLGGAHGSYFVKGMNFNPVTGDLLSLKEVVTDYDQTYEYTKEYLQREVDEEAFFPDYLDSLEQMFYGEEWQSDQLSWSLDSQELTLYFNQYVLGPYSSGMFVVEIPFDGDKKLVKEDYVPKGNGTVRKIWEGVETVLSEEGNGQTFSYSIQRNEDAFTNTITLQLGQESMDKELYGFFVQAYLVQMSEEGNWLYVECMEDNDWRTLHVFDLNQKQPSYVGIGEGYIGEHVFSNGENFALYERIDLLGTYIAFRHYQVGPDGLPKALEDIYSIVENDYSITSTVELPVQMHKGDGESVLREQEILPSGTKYYLRKTDGKTFVEMELEDGRRCDILLEKEDFFSKINGMDEADCFEFLRYVG